MKEKTEAILASISFSLIFVLISCLFTLYIIFLNEEFVLSDFNKIWSIILPASFYGFILGVIIVHIAYKKEGGIKK